MADIWHIISSVIALKNVTKVPINMVSGVGCHEDTDRLGNWKAKLLASLSAL